MNPEDASPSPKTKQFRLLVIAFLVVSIGGGLLLKQFAVGWIGSAALVALLLVMTLLMMRAAKRMGEETGCASPAAGRYNRRMMWSSMAYMVALFLSVLLFRRGEVSGALLWPLALFPAAAVLGMVWAMGRLLVEETDEYLRFRIAKRALFAAGGLLAVSTVWGFLEQFGLVAHIPAWVSVPVFALMLGLGQCFDRDRA